MKIYSHVYSTRRSRMLSGIKIMRHPKFTRSQSFVRAFLLTAGIIAVVFSCQMAGHAQDDQNHIQPARGFHPSHSYSVDDIATISTTSGNLMLTVPLASLPAGRGGHPGFQLSLRYNSKVWDGEADVAEVPNRPSQTVNVVWLRESDEGGWRYNIPKNFHWFLDNRNDHGIVYPVSDPRRTHIWKLKLVFPDGSAREMRPYGFDDGADDGYFAVQPAAGMSYFSFDGSYLRLDIGSNGAWNLFFPDGTKVENISSGVQRTLDRHGSSIERQLLTNYNGTGHNADKIVDQLGRAIIVEYGVGEDYIHATGVNGASLLTTVKWGKTWVNKIYRAGNHFQFDTTLARGLDVVTEIDLPLQLGTGLKYLFGYNGNTASGMGTSIGWGEVSSLTLPMGASASFQYNMDNKSGSGWPSNFILANFPNRKDVNYTLEYDNSTAPAPTQTWTYNIGASGALTTAPDGGVTQEWFSPAPSLGRVYKTKNPDGSFTERLWKQNRPFSPPGVTIHSTFVINPFVEVEFLSIPDATGTLILTSMRQFSYDKNGNLTMLKEYDWVPYSSVTRDTLGNPTGIPASATVIRVSTNAYHCETPNALDTSTNDPDSYDRANSPTLKKAIKSNEVGNGTQTVARTEYTYDNALSTGNLTEQRSWDSAKGPIKASPPLLDTSNSIATTTAYDPHGNPTLITDARQVQTQFIYGLVGSVDNLYPTEIKTAYQTPVQRWQKKEYDFDTGLVTADIDWDNSVTTTTEYDDIGRPILVRAAKDRAEEVQTSTQYFATERRVVTRSDLETTGDGKLAQVVHFDQLGRVRLMRILEEYSAAAAANELVGIKKQTRYLINNPCQPTNGAQCLIDNNAVLASYVLTSTSYRAATSSDASAESTMGWSRTRADKGGRVVEIQTFSGGSLPAPWGANAAGTGTVSTAYDGVFTTVTDQAGRPRRSKIDGVGQVIRIDEPADSANTLGSQTSPLQATNYQFDALGNLRVVTQGGQTRTYVYSSLKRLTNANNPESGVFDYEYDAVGNMTKKIDSRFVPNTSTRRTIIYGYDSLNRVTARTYNDGTPNVTYNYDNSQVPFGRGRLTSVTTSVSSYSYGGYDPFGRTTAATQTTDGQPYTMSYAYNISGALASQTYPSGKVVKTNYDGAGRPAGVKNDATGIYYAGADSTDTTNRLQYSPSGSLQLMKLGNNLWEHVSYNSRLRPTQIGLGTTGADSSKLKLDYTYGVIINGNLDSSKDNGNMQSQTVTVGTTALKQTYTYDELNRLKSAEETNNGAALWKQTYLYDRFGNRRFDKDNTNLPQITTPNENVTNPTISTANNRISGTGYRYDTGGNLECDPTHPCGAVSPFTAFYDYDAENRLKTANGGSANGGATYLYDGHGRRVKKIVGGANAGTTVFVYNVAGQLIAEYGDVASAGVATSYITSDHLGTPRVITKPNGDVLGRHDYQPFGEEIDDAFGRTAIPGYAAADKLRQQFSGKERDTETQLDYFGARYYASTYGRFTGVDPGPFTPADPQNFNRYAYVQNNPLKFIDPNGEELIITGDDAEYVREQLEKATGYKLKRDPKTGKVTIDESSKRSTDKTSKSLADKVKEVIDLKDTKGNAVTITINVVNDTDSEKSVVMIDRFATKSVDANDLKQLEEVPEFLASQLGHVLEEYAVAATVMAGQPADRQEAVGHLRARKFESKVMSDFTGKDEEARRDTQNGTKVSFIYSTVQYDMETKGDKKPDNATITSVSKKP